MIRRKYFFFFFYYLVGPVILDLFGTSTLKERSGPAAAPWKALLESATHPQGPALQNGLMKRLHHSQTIPCLAKETQC